MWNSYLLIFPNIYGCGFSILWFKNRTVPCFVAGFSLLCLIFLAKCDIIRIRSGFFGP